jgi:pyruvate dehydrogenase E1 component beta subunit
MVLTTTASDLARLPGGIWDASAAQHSIWPWDREAVLDSVAKTGRLLVVHEAIQAAGFGAEIVATVAETTGARVKRLGAPRIPVGYSPPLEAQSRISAEAIAAAVRAFVA